MTTKEPQENDRKEQDDRSGPEGPERWTAKRKVAVILDIIKGKTTAVEVARKQGLTVSEVEEWMERFLKGGEEHLRTHPRDLAAQFAAERKELHAKIGELSLHVDVLKKAHVILGKDLPEGIS